MFKVKAHTEVIGNEVADQEAKNSISLEYSHYTNSCKGLDKIIDYFPLFRRLSIKQKLRKFVNNVFSMYNSAEWSQLKSFNDHVSANDTEWKISWTAFRSVTRFHSNSRKKQTAWAFMTKFFTKSLH